LNLLIGATGFVGGHVVEYLLQQGELSKATFRKGSHLKILDANGAQAIEADPLDHRTLHEAFEGVDTVYSMASPMPYGDTDFTKANFQGALNILEAAKEAKVRTIVHLSTLDVYGFGGGSITESSKPRPSNEYQRAKFETDRILFDFSKNLPGLRIVIIRPAKAIGSRDRSTVVPLLRLIEAGKVELAEPKITSFTHPKDIAQAMYRAATNPSLGNTIFPVKSFDATMDDVAQNLANDLGVKISVKRLGRFSKSPLPQYTAEQIKAGLHLDTVHGWNELGYSPQFNLNQTCQEIVQWYRKEPWITENV
jgi:nucleoside-diphosphate-sugar epimerase